MHIEGRFWNNPIGDTDDSLNLVAFLEDRGKEEIALAEIFSAIGLDRQGWDFHRTVEYMEDTPSNGVETGSHCSELSIRIQRLMQTYDCKGGEKMTDEWMKRYRDEKDKLTSRTDLDAYFTERKIGNTDVDTMDIGTVSFPTGRILACDPLIELEDRPPYLQAVPPGTYPVTICVIPSEKYGNRYACVKVTVSDARPVRYDMAMVGDENLDEDLEEGDYFGFIVDAGMGCIADVGTQKAFREYWAKRLEEDEDIDPYNDLFCDLLEESYNENPRYQRDGGDWANWTVPGTDLSIPIFASGWGDGAYPCYFGYDSDGNVSGVYILFIEIEDDPEE